MCPSRLEGSAGISPTEPARSPPTWDRPLRQPSCSRCTGRSRGCPRATPAVRGRGIGRRSGVREPVQAGQIALGDRCDHDRSSEFVHPGPLHFHFATRTPSNTVPATILGTRMTSSAAVPIHLQPWEVDPIGRVFSGAPASVKKALAARWRRGRPRGAPGRSSRGRTAGRSRAAARERGLLRVRRPALESAIVSVLVESAKAHGGEGSHAHRLGPTEPRRPRG